MHMAASTKPRQGKSTTSGVWSPWPAGQIFVMLCVLAL